MVSYPFSFRTMLSLIFAILIFILLLILGFKKKVLNASDSIRRISRLQLLTSVVNGIVGYYSWQFLKWVYPGYTDILHGLYIGLGHAYVSFAFALFSHLAHASMHIIGLGVIKTANLLVAPFIIWIIICGLVAVYLKGAAFFYCAFT